LNVFPDYKAKITASDSTEIFKYLTRRDAENFILDKLTVLRLVKSFAAPYGTQQPTSSPYPEADEFHPQLPELFL